MKLSSRVFLIIGTIAIAISLCIFGLTFYPVILEELQYNAHTLSNAIQPNRTIVPIDEEFGIVIPKLGANARVIANVDPYKANEYQYALIKGVAHAKGSAVPGTAGNIFLFSHSSVNFYEATRYNSVFYLLQKLEKGDEVVLYYQKQTYTYEVTDTKMVNPSEVTYLTNSSSEQTLTLMTCWPPGTTFQRLLIIATLTSD